VPSRFLKIEIEVVEKKNEAMVKIQKSLSAAGRFCGLK
jgi:hypothetical protein